MQAFQMDLEKFKERDTQVIGISPDSLETHEKFSEKYNLAFPLITDSDGKVRQLYGRGRITYLIDKHGTIQYVQEGVPDNNSILRKLREITNSTE